tara:strand:+ start:8862 stop:9953 length:1092 start_codon:yes stop_codon:yes gene_type:complete
MANKLNYKNTLNSFVDSSKSYSLNIKNRLTTLTLDYNMGLTEELMNDRNFTTGTLGTSSGDYMVGIPNRTFEKIVDYYNVLKDSITGETTTIQTQFNTLDPIISERNYIKNVLLTHLENQFTNITNEVNMMINSLRDQQHNLTKTIDILNFVTNISHDGQFLNRSGGRVAALVLTGTSEVIKLSTHYNGTNKYMKDYINDYVNNKFPLNYGYGGEYLFFTNLIYTKDLRTLSFSGNFNTELNKLIDKRKNILYVDLLNVDNNRVNGLDKTMSVHFRTLLLKLFKSWVRYDISLINDRIFSGVEEGYKILDTSIKNYKNNFNVGYSYNTGSTAQNLVRNYLVDRNRGVDDNKFNYKLINQLYVG